MAGGKLTPRQKMINLMYLVFIAMLAMNMSKEVLSAFGLMNEKFESANTNSLATNTSLLNGLDAKAGEDQHFVEAAKRAHSVEAISKKFFDYIETLKKGVLVGVEKDKETGKLPYEAMDKGDNIDNSWFTGEGYSTKGKEIITTIEKYKADMKAALGTDDKFKDILAEINKKFDLADVANKEGIKIKYLEYHFDKFPAVASLAKLSAWQSDVKKSESDVYSSLLGKAAVAAASMKNYTAIVVPDKTAFFQGESVTGKVFLGRFDKNTVPTGVTVNGSAAKVVDGQAQFSFGAGAVGEHDITGKFNFMEDGKIVPIDIKGNYVVVPKPNQAIVSADKMNVVYRGVPNPISVSVPGVSANNVHANAAGMSPAGKPGAYILKPGTGTEVKVMVSATLPNGGGNFGSSQVFRIKGLPAPTGKIRGEVSAKGQRNNLETCSITAVMEDFDFPVNVNVTQFNIKVPGQPTIVVSGNKMDGRARSAIQKATRGDVVVISEIKASFIGIDQVAKRVSTCTYEVQ